MAERKKERYFDWLKEEFISVQIPRDTIVDMSQNDNFSLSLVDLGYIKMFVSIRLPTTHNHTIHTSIVSIISMMIVRNLIRYATPASSKSKQSSRCLQLC